MTDITLILDRLNKGEHSALDELVPLIYAELHQRASRQVGRGGHTLQPTALVNEVFIRLLGYRDPHWQSSRHFFNAAAEVMRQIVVNYARSEATLKRGGDRKRVMLEGVEPIAADDQVDWEALDGALKELQQLDQRRYQVVMLRFFAGLTDAQIAQSLEIAEKTVERDWKAAKVFLRVRMKE